MLRRWVKLKIEQKSSGYATWFTAGGAVREPQTPKNTSFLVVTQPPGVAQPLNSRGHN